MTDTHRIEEAAREALAALSPAEGLTLGGLHVIPGLEVGEGNVRAALELPLPPGMVDPGLGAAAADALRKLPGVTGAEVEIRCSIPASRAATDLLPEVRNVIAVSSGKGGVGKSTVTVNIAVTLARLGARVGVLDADVYGPNVPIMFGAREQPYVLEGKLQPLERYGVRLMSLGFLVPPEEAVIWRGPMVMQALEQMMRDVAWGALDYLLVDMPPGTGDAQLTMTQRVPLAGAILVSTPQAVALGDTIKGLMMFRKTETPILGMVENMSLFHCPHCGEPSELFERGTVEAACRRFEVPYLGDIPFDLHCRKGGDAGVPISWSEPDSEVGQAFGRVAGRLAAGVAGQAAAPARRVVEIVRR